MTLGRTQDIIRLRLLNNLSLIHLDADIKEEFVWGEKRLCAHSCHLCKVRASGGKIGNKESSRATKGGGDLDQGE